MNEQSNDRVRVSDDERRESPRVSMRFLVRRADTADMFESREGNLSLGGFAWFGAALPVGSKVEVRFTLPGSIDEFHLRGEVLNVGHGSKGSSAHARFLELPVEAEMRIARYLDDLELSESNPRGGA
jgi:hypothetical protein